MDLDNQSLYIILGGIGQIILWLFYKILRNKKIFFIVLILTILLALLGYLNTSRESLKMPNGNAATWAFLPLFFMIYYWILRTLFLIIFGNEPLMTGYMQSSWEQGEDRRLHMGDAIFTVLTLILPFLTTSLFH
jgi:predicted membrane protein